jgi:hypothetical protein
MRRPRWITTGVVRVAVQQRYRLSGSITNPGDDDTRTRAVPDFLNALK